MAADPRDIITEQAFRVEPSLLGTPLATPARRAVALGLDFFFAAVLSKIFGSLLIGLLALFFFRSARRTRIKGVLSRMRSYALYLASFLFAFVFMLSALADLTGPGNFGNGWDFDFSRDGEAPKRARQEIEEAFDKGEPVPEPPTDRHDYGGDEEGIEQAKTIIKTIMPFVPEDAREELKAELRNLEASTATAALTATTTATSSPSVRRSESDGRPEPCPEKEEWTPMSILVAFFDGLGITFGWFGFYFTVAHAWGRGQSPGKRLLGIRVLRLDGSPLRMWDAFERFSGFGAGVATGLLGFLQIYWDPNRQAIHDKICTTVVIREKGAKT